MNSDKLEFVPGTWVFYNNPNHQYHGMSFQISKLLPMVGLNSPKPHKGFLLTYGSRSVEASHSELVKRGTPEAKPFETGEYQVKSGKFTGTVENPQTIPRESMNMISHEGHEVVTNYAGGKPFQYCRNCKEEVMDGTTKDKKA